ncbi:hypothetical protein [Brevundimonas sp.]|uniref:hypothetical protein n=1 Tax=Brevundimonas sp. TaxID=1871086 RepID=UPI0011FA2E00|nr:hypothetical protein [Brevundimonas sp.]TAJ65435.1 MAG: hypothetical protein EPO49_03115 [Brevundimonas sp.]
MRVLPALLASTALLGACATPMEPGPGGPPMADGNDCAVIAAIAKEHYRFNDTDNRPLPIRFEGDYAPRCDWSRYGLAFQPYDPDAPGDPRERVRWVSFARPVYDGGGAVVATGIMHGPLAGMGYECRVISGFAGWTVPEGSCRNTWVS